MQSESVSNRLPTLQRLEVGPYESNCYVVSFGDAAAVIDTGDNADEILKAVEKTGAKKVAVLLTHGHADHISALPAVLAGFPAGTKAYMSADDAAWAFEPFSALPGYVHVTKAPDALDTSAAVEGGVIKIGELSFRCLATPGHTPGGVCWLLEGFDIPLLFTGDTLFYNSIGRTDFPGGDDIAMQQSLRRLVALDPATRVFPGHGPASNIAREAKSNPYVS